MLAIYDKAKVSHRLSVEALLLSEENYHTQLELYEVFSMPDQARVADFYLHEGLFSKQLDKVYADYFDHKNDVSPRILIRLESIKEAIPNIQGYWHRYLKSVNEKKPLSEQLKLLIAAEHAFDKEMFNTKIRDIVDLQLEEVDRFDFLMNELTQKNTMVIMFGIFIALLLTCIVAFLHRSALQGKINELQLIQAGKLASLGQLSAGLAHELNTPLMFISGYNSRVRAYLKKENISSESPAWEYLDEIDAGSERISRLIKHFRDFARLSTHEMKPVSLNQIIEKSFILFEEQLRLREIRVETDLTPEAPLIQADALGIEQVLLNLISNSRDALMERKNGEKKIFIRTMLEDGHVILKFSDTGKGISKEHLSRIFDPFFTTKPQGIGTGLGLSISAGILRDHRAKVDVKSTLDVGTEFRLTFKTVSNISS